MKFRVKVGALVEQITQAAITVDRKAPELPSGKVYLRALVQKATKEGEEDQPVLVLFSTNQAQKTFIKIKVDAVEQEGQVLVGAAKLLGGLVGRDESQVVDVELITKTDEQKLRVKIGKNFFHLPYDINVETAAAAIKALPKGKFTAKIAAQTLIEFIRRSWFCIPSADNGQQDFAMGVLNLKGGGGNYTAQATDGSIVVQHKAKQTETTTFSLSSLLVPVEALDPLQKLLQQHKDADIELIEGEKTGKGDLKEVFFRMDGVLFSTVLRVSKYPNLEILLDSHKPTFRVDVNREELKSTLVRAANFVEQAVDKRGVQLTTEDSTTLKVFASNDLTDLKDDLEIAVSDGSFKAVAVSVGIDYLSNVTAVQSGDKISLGFNSSKEKALVASETVGDFETRYAISPLVTDVAPAKKNKKKTDKAAAPEPEPEPAEDLVDA